MITLKNEYITAKFSTLGAELKSLVYEGKEHIWQSDPNVWAGACPLMWGRGGNSDKRLSCRLGTLHQGGTYPFSPRWHQVNIRFSSSSPS